MCNRSEGAVDQKIKFWVKGFVGRILKCVIERRKTSFWAPDMLSLKKILMIKEERKRRYINHHQQRDIWDPIEETKPPPHIVIEWTRSVENKRGKGDLYGGIGTSSFFFLSSEIHYYDRCTSYIVGCKFSGSMKRNGMVEQQPLKMPPSVQWIHINFFVDEQSWSSFLFIGRWSKWCLLVTEQTTSLWHYRVPKTRRKLRGKNEIWFKDFFPKNMIRSALFILLTTKTSLVFTLLVGFLVRRYTPFYKGTGEWLKVLFITGGLPTSFKEGFIESMHLLFYKTKTITQV